MILVHNSYTYGWSQRQLKNPLGYSSIKSCYAQKTCQFYTPTLYIHTSQCIGDSSLIQYIPISLVAKHCAYQYGCAWRKYFTHLLMYVMYICGYVMCVYLTYSATALGLLPFNSSFRHFLKEISLHPSQCIKNTITGLMINGLNNRSSVYK